MEAPRTNEVAAGAGEKFAAALLHIIAFVVKEGTHHFLGSTHADVIGGIRAGTTETMIRKQVIPAVVINHLGCIAVHRNIHGRVAWVQSFAGLEIEFNQPDVA